MNNHRKHVVFEFLKSLFERFIRQTKVLCLTPLTIIASLVPLSAQSVDRSHLLSTVTADPTVVTGAAGVDEVSITTVLHVRPEPDALAGALKTASEHLRAGNAVKIILTPGIYREGEFILDGAEIGGSAVETPLVITAEQPGTAIIDGSDIFPPENWTPIKNKDGEVVAYEHPWNFDWGFWPGSWRNYNPKNPREHRREVATLNGKPLRQVLLERYEYNAPATDPIDHEKSLPFPDGVTQDAYLASLDLPNHTKRNVLSNINGYGVYRYNGFDEPTSLPLGTFAIAERPENGNRIFIAPPVGVEWQTAKPEIAVRTHLLWILNKSNIVMRGLKFRMAAAISGPRSAVRVGWWAAPKEGETPYRNILIEQCHFDFTSGTQLEISYLQDVTLRNVRARYAAISGITTNHVRNMLWESVETSFNHWRYPGGWAGGGSKNHNIQDGLFRNVTAAGNDAAGLWFDIDCANITVDGFIAYGNDVGLDFEISRGLLVRNSAIVANSRAAVALKTAELMSIENSIIAGPTGVANFIFQASSRSGSGEKSIQARLGLPVNDRYALDTLTIKDSVILAIPQETCPAGAERYNHDRGVRATGFVAPLFSQHHGSPDKFKDFLLKGVTGKNNLWFSPQKEAFGITKIYSDEWRSKLNVNEMVDFDGWVALVGELGSQWIDPEFTDPLSLDFTPKPGSPASHMKLPSLSISSERRAEWEVFRKADFYKNDVKSEVDDAVNP